MLKRLLEIFESLMLQVLLHGKLLEEISRFIFTVARATASMIIKVRHVFSRNDITFFRAWNLFRIDLPKLAPKLAIFMFQFPNEFCLVEDNLILLDDAFCLLVVLIPQLVSRFVLCSPSVLTTAKAAA